MISNIITIINFIGIVVLFILFFTKSSTETFKNAPSGYTNLLVSDSEGNLDTFSTAVLEADIDTKISTALKSYTNTVDLQKVYATKSELRKGYQPKGNYATMSSLQKGYQPKGNYVNVDKVYSIFTPTGWGMTDGHGPNVGYLYGSGNDWKTGWNGDGRYADKNLQWVIREWPPPKNTIRPV